MKQSKSVCVSAAVLHVQQAFVLLLDATLLCSPTLSVPPKTCGTKTLSDMKMLQTDVVASPSNWKHRISIEISLATANGNGSSQFCVVCGECESLRLMKRKQSNQTSIRLKFSIDSISICFPSNKTVQSLMVL